MNDSATSQIKTSEISKKITEKEIDETVKWLN